jgi:chemotaxis protein CheX
LEGPYRKIDVAFINPFLSAVKEVFSTQVRIDIRPHKPFLAGSGNQPECAIVGLVALNCNQFRGNIALCFNADVFLKIYERMLGEKHETITCEIEDGVAELLNIIYGTAKTVLNREQGLDLKPALPTILTGEKITLRRSPDSQVLILPFESDAGLFHVEIARTLSNETQKRSA